MKLALRILGGLFAIVVLALAGLYIDGTTLPLNHRTSVTATVPAPPDKVFARIVGVANGAAWRPAVLKVTMLTPDSGRDHWIEDLGHGQTMTFLALRTEPPTTREVQLDVPGATYGGTWLYQVTPGPAPETSTLTITETGFIQPPLYRFMVHHVIGMTYNLDHYEQDITKSFQH